MKRKSFLIICFISAVAVITLSSLTIFPKKEKWNCVRNSSELEATFVLPGIEKAFTIMQIADSHISYENESDREFDVYSKRMREANPTVLHYKTKEKVSSFEGFASLIAYAKEQKVDCIALSGDIFSYPSETAINAVYKLLQDTNIPYIFTSGNHDWHYEGMPGSAENLRNEWIEKRLRKLYKGENPLYSSELINGVNIVTIDNSTYQISQEQVDFYKKQVLRKEPIALFLHIPIYMPSIGNGSCGDPNWGAAIDYNYKIERRERWPESGNDKNTYKFIEEVMKTEKLVGIFAGHLHRSFTISSNEKYQYIAGAGIYGQYRMIKFIPLSDK